MASSRDRMLRAFQYSSPDRLPVVYHPSPAGLHVHGEALLDLFRQYPPDNPVTFTEVPQPPPGTVDDDGRYHELRRDEWGTEWEYLIFGVAGHPHAYPVRNWAEARHFAFPPVPGPGTTEREQRRTEVHALKQDYLVFDGWISLLERLHALRPIDDVLAGLVNRDPALLAFLKRLTVYWHEVLDYLLSTGVDVVVFGDDWGTQTAPIISPGLFREIFRPRYAELMGRVKESGRKVFLHCCGRVGPLLDDFLELGIDGYWPQINCYHLDELAGRCRDYGVALYLHPDRQYLIPRGTPAEIESTIQGYAQRWRTLGGGGIFYVELENDAPFDNARALIESIDRYR